MLDLRRRAKTLLSNLARDRRGAIAPTFGIMFAVVVVPVAGATVDISRSIGSRNDLQDAADATVLVLSKMPASSTPAQLQTAANQWMAANVTDKNMGPITLTVTPSYNSTGSGTNTIDLTATSTVKTTVSAIIGLNQIPVTAHSTTTWGLSHVELALVLDNTGSMAQDNKLSSLQSAATNLVNTLSTSATNSGDPNSLKVAVVPFTMTVNVGPSYQGQSWLVGSMPSTYGYDTLVGQTNRFTLFSYMKQGGQQVTWAGCVESRPAPYDVQDTAPTSTDSRTYFVPYFAPDEPDDNTLTFDGTHYYVPWSQAGNNPSGYPLGFINNYVPDKTNSTDPYTRQSNPSKYYNGMNIATGNNPAGFAYGPNSGCGITPLLRLTANMTTVQNKLNQMVATGDTMIQIGLMWGWHVLSPNAPFADGAAYGTNNLKKIVVLVTDGYNHWQTGSTNSPNDVFNGPDIALYEGLGYPWQNRVSGLNMDATDGSQPAIDARMTQVCNNMKAAGIVIYAVPLEVTDANKKALLQNCASSPDKYIDVASSSQLQAAFTNIAGSISQLRISQ